MAEPDDTTAAAGQRSVEDTARDQERIYVYERLMAAEDAIAQARYARGVDHAAVEAALDAADTGPTPAERGENLYLSALEHYVASLGGRLELRAVFPDETVTIDPRQR